MKIQKLFRALTVPALLALAGAVASAASLKIGDPAPPLQVASWAQGEPVTGFDTNHAYIVEFWATWCGPCRMSIPHLNEIWKEFKDKDLIVIGQDCWENQETNVAPFIVKMGEKMTYRVALDDKSTETNGAMAINWMKAAGQNGIPTAFIVDRHGKIAWIGHPLGLTNTVVEEILADKFDVAAYAKEFDLRQQEQEKAREQQKVSMEAFSKVSKAMKAKDWDAADKALPEWEKTVPAGEQIQVTLVRLRILMGRGDYAGAYKMAQETSDASATNVAVQNALASSFSFNKDLNAEGIALAQKFVQRAEAAADGKNWQVLNTGARVRFMAGQTNEAIASEQKAIDLAPDQIKPYLQKYLADYQSGKLPE